MSTYYHLSNYDTLHGKRLKPPYCSTCWAWFFYSRYLFSIHAFFKIVPSGNHNTAVQPSLCPFSFILCFAGQFVCIQWTATEHIMNQDNPSNRALFGLHLRSGELSRLLKQRGLFEEMNWTEPPECRKQKVTFKNFLCKSKTREYKQNWQQFNEVQQNWSNLVHTRVCSCNWMSLWTNFHLIPKCLTYSFIHPFPFIHLSCFIS